MSVHPVTKREGGGWSVFENSNWPMRKQLKGRREFLFEFSGQLSCLENERGVMAGMMHGKTKA